MPVPVRSAITPVWVRHGGQRGQTMRRQSAQRAERPIRRVSGQGRRNPGKDRRKGQRAAKNPGTVAIPGFALARKEGFELPGRGFILYFCISKSSNKFAFLQLSLHYVAKGFNQFYRDKGQNKGRE